MAEKSITYRRVEIKVWDQSVQVGHGQVLWFKRPVTDEDIMAIKTMIQAGRDSMADEIRTLRQKTRMLIGEPM